MAPLLLKRIGGGRQFPQDIEPETLNTIMRIEEQHSVMGVVYIKNGLLKLSSVPESMAQTLFKRLPIFTEGVCQALKEIDVLDELMAYRIETKSVEILVAAGKEYTACVVHRIKKAGKHKKSNKIIF